MRRARVDTQALARSLSAAATGHTAVDLRFDAFGLGVTRVSELAHDAGFTGALTSPNAREGCVLPETAEELVAKNWWSGEDPSVFFQADVISVKRVPAGSPVSYGYEYRTAGEATLALVAAGFSDGVPRTASPGAEISLGGKRFPVAGRIAMDQMIVDVGDHPVTLGEVATIWGDSPSLSEWADWSRRPEAALLAHLASRVERQWV
jgi:alanine racemase